MKQDSLHGVTPPRPHLRSPDSWELCDAPDCKHLDGGRAAGRLTVRAISTFGLMLLGIAFGAALRHDAMLLRFILIAEVPLALAMASLMLGFGMRSRRSKR